MKRTKTNYKGYAIEAIVSYDLYVYKFYVKDKITFATDLTTVIKIIDKGE